MKNHTSKVDKWYSALVIGVALLPFIMSAFFGSLIWASVVICALSAGFMIWLYAATKYVIQDETLTIHGGVFKVSIPRSAITSITETSNAMSGPAFSLDRLEIKYGEGKMILISPKDKPAFLADLGWPVSA